MVLSNDNSSFYSAMETVKQNYGQVHPYLSCVICLSGILMNLASIVVLTRRSMIVSLINCILACIAAFDGLTVTSYLYLQLRTLTFSTCRSRFTYEMIVTLLIHANLSVVCHTVSIWLTVSMAVIRALTIRNVSSAAAAAACSRRNIGGSLGVRPFNKALILALLISTLTFLLNVPTMLSFVISESTCERLCGHVELCPKRFQVTNTIHHSLRLQPPPSPPRYFTASRIRNNGVLLDAAFWITGIVFKILPCLCLTVFIVVLIYILAGVKRRRERLRRNACDQNQRADKTTFMLIVLLTVFLISESPQGLLLILSGLNDEFRARIYLKLGDLMDLLSLINGAANFVIYFIMSEKFRQVFCITLLPPKTYHYFFQNRALSLVVSAVEMNNCVTLIHNNDMNNGVNGEKKQKQRSSSGSYSNQFTLLNRNAAAQNKLSDTE